MNELRIGYFLPYKTENKANGEIRTCLTEFQSLLSASLKAVEVWEKEDFEKFDSLVGENACQIRALQACLLAMNEKVDCELQEKIKNNINKVQQILESRKLLDYMKDGKSFSNLIEDEDLDIHVSPKIAFIIASYLLTIMKEVRSEISVPSSIFRVERADSKKFMNFGSISNSFAQKLLYTLRRWLADTSVEFVRNCAHKLNDPLLIKMSSEEFTVSKDTLRSTPMFWTYKTILQTASKHQIPLLVHTKLCRKTNEGYPTVEEGWGIFQVTTHGTYRLQNPSLFDLEQPAIVVQGIATEDQTGNLLTWDEWLSLVEEMTITDVILAGAADHRQYPDERQDQVLLQSPDEEYLRYKHLAETKGFSASNPTHFFIQHVYAAKINKTIPNSANLLWKSE